MSLLSLLGMQETASIDALAAENIKEKIIDVHLLPRYDDVMQLMRLLRGNGTRGEGRSAWVGFCNGYDIYHTHTVEFVDELAGEIRKLGHGPAVEVCAGNGKLSYHLRQRGIDIRPTDIYTSQNSRDSSLVEKLSCIEALKKYNPRIVVASWICSDSNIIGIDIMKFPSVKYFIHIQHYNGANDSWLTLKAEDTAKIFKLQSSRLRGIEQYGICGSDYHDIQKHTRVVLVKKPGI